MTVRLPAESKRLSLWEKRAAALLPDAHQENRREKDS